MAFQIAHLWLGRSTGSLTDRSGVSNLIYVVITLAFSALYAAIGWAIVTRQPRNTFVVTDDGRGFDQGATGCGAGLQGIADRLDAIGGTLSVTSRIEAGTTITGTVPAAHSVTRA